MKPNSLRCKSSWKQKRLFPFLYLNVTIEIKNKLAEGYFDNTDLIEKLDVVFANRYLQAYRDYEQRKPISASWQVAFEATNLWKPLVIQHLFLGMNAHISFDLGIAAATVAPGNSIHNIKTDFERVNEILSSKINPVQDNLSAIWPFLKPIDWIMGNIDESLASFSIRVARDAAWKMAVELASFQTETEKQQYLSFRDNKVANFGNKLYHPGILLSLLLGLIRLGETGNIADKIRILSR
ncbi:MAG: DUF5995 family protein [Bacteroidales bacterium]